MPEIILGLVIVLLILGFALYGFIRFLMFVFGSRDSQPAPQFQLDRKPARWLGDDVLAASHLLNYLFLKKRIDEKTYRRLRSFLEKEFADEHELSKPVVGTKIGLSKPIGQPKTVIDDRGELREVAGSDVELRESPPIAPEPVPVQAPPVVLQPTSIPSASIKDQDDVTVVAPATAAPAAPSQPAPWDIPDPPAPEPRRSFGEIMAGFMLEKNIRWGELASGILIVGSAVGLVVSLRDELRDTIPYFSALLFLLITAAIHGSGIYTLKKWKLRTTSRGTLLIGLLLIPLNILAACILSGNEVDRRELTDPLLWIAIAIGLSAFSAMTWYSSKCLFRRGQLPMVIAVMGFAIGTLVINRIDNLDSSSLRKLLLTLPLVASFLVGTAAFYKRQWLRTRWTERATNRLFIFLGMSSFAFLVAASLLIVRAEQKSAAVVALMPALSVVTLMTTWLGRIVWRGAVGAEERRLRLSGLTLHVLGLVLMGVSVFISASNPTILLINTAILAVGLALFAKHQAEPRLLPAAWVAFATFILCTVNLLIGKLNWDEWATAKELIDAAISGQSGLSLLAAGAAVAGLHSIYGSRAKDQSKFMRVGWLSGAAIFLVGCGLALIASFVNRDNRFDTMTATSLLGLASFLSLGVCVKKVTPTDSTSSSESKLLEILPHAAAVLLFGFLAHAFIWNREIQNWLNQVAFGVNANWVIVFAAHSLVMTAIAVVSRYRSSSSLNSDGNQRRVADLLGEWSSVTSVMAFLGVFVLIQYQTGLATAIAVALSVGWLMLVWVQSDHRFGIRYWMSWFVGSTSLCVVVFVSELVTKTSWCPDYQAPRFWLVQIIALSIWSATWIAISCLLPRIKRMRKFFDFQPRVEWALLHSLVVAAGMTVGLALIGGTATELFPNASEPLLSLTGDKAWVFGALGVIGVALSLAVFQKPIGITGAGLVATWFLVWGMGSDYFIDSKSVGSALRWLLPIGGAVAAILVASRKPLRPAWAAARNSMGLRGRSTWSGSTTQVLINFALAIVAIIVLLISTIAITQVLMHGGMKGLGGPTKGSWFGDLQKDVSYGIPVGIMVGTFLLYAISERRKMVGDCRLRRLSILCRSRSDSAVRFTASPAGIELVCQYSAGSLRGHDGLWFRLVDFKDRIEGKGGVVVSDPAVSESNRLSQIEIHTSINGFLITSLAVLVMGRFYLFPAQSGDWINTVGSPLGIVAWALFGGLAFAVWRDKLNQPHRTSTWMWLACWMGLVLVAMVAAFVDRRYAIGENTVPWLTFNVIMWGAVAVSLSQVVLLWLERRPEWVPGVYREQSSQRFTSVRADQTLPLLFSGSIVLSFAVRGAWLDSGSFWIYFAAIGLSIGFLVIAGLIRRSAPLSFISLAVTTLASILLVEIDPAGWFRASQPYHANVLSLALVLLALVWSGFYVYRSLGKNEQIRRSFTWMPNLVLLLASIWVLLGAVGQWIIETGGAPNANSLANAWGVGAIIGPVFLSVLHLWNDHRKFQVISRCLWITGVMILGLAIVIPETGLRNAGILFGLGAVVTIWGLVWANRKTYFGIARKLNAPALIRLERSMDRQLPILGLIMGGIVLIWAFAAILSVDARPERYLTAMSPFAVAFGLGCMSDERKRRWLQLTTLSLVTMGAIFLAWADLTPSQIGPEPMRLFVRALLVLAGAMFVYGGLVARWVREGDSWLKSLREMAVVTCSLALLCLGLVMWQEIIQFQPGVGCGMPMSEAIAVAVVVLGMVVGLILIAIVPKNDPFSLSLQGRMGYVYAAQLVAAMLVIHLYLTMPWLFELGIKDYWPYIAMILCFGGVGFARVLENRQLTVLGQPLFNTAAILPVVVAAAIWAIDSKADASLVMLTVGMAYLMISYTHNSILSGAAAILFGNLALWLFYHELDGFAFVEHPQLWLIPPALSALVAAQLSRKSLTQQQLALIRYLCVTVIYLSSTSEIFISGLGQKLWPPIVLAVLAVGGMMAGMMFQVRAYLYLGSVFLLLAMISMVSHAHQRLDHVWPWWAFGIGMGISILVMFGLFEKRKNDMKEITGRLKEWDL